MRFGIIGTNFVTDWFVKNGRQTENFSIGAVYSRTMSRAREYGAPLGCTAFFDDLEAFLSYSDIDAVYIASPHRCHKEQALLALSHGKHVLIEKPAALNAADAREMLAAAKANGRVIMEAMRPVHNPALSAIKQALPKIGDVRRALIFFNQYSSRYDRFKAGDRTDMNAFDPTLGNMALLDVGVYSCALMTALFGKPNSVYADFITLENGFEAAGNLSLSYDGMLASVQYSKINNSKNRIELQGERGSLLIGDAICLEDAVIEYDDGSCETVWPHTTGRSGDMVHEIRDFNALTEGKADMEPFWEITVSTIELMDRAREFITKI